MGSSFGSICFGSLVAAIIMLIQKMLRDAQRKAQSNNNMVLCLVLCIIRCCCAYIQAIMEFINDLAFSQVALFGKAYVPAVKDTINLMFRYVLPALPTVVVVLYCSPLRLLALN